MVAVRKGYRNKAWHYEKTTVTLNGSGTGTTTVTFDTAYQNAPVAVVVPHLGAAGTWEALSITTTGFILTVTGATDLASQTVEVLWIAHEKL